MLFKIKSLIDNIRQKGFFHLLSANFLIQFLGFGTQLLVAKFLLPSEMADIKVIQSYISVITILAGFGFNTAVLKICSEEQDQEKKSAILRKTTRLSFYSISITLLGFIILAVSGVLGFTLHIKKWMIVYLLSVPASVYTFLFMQYLQSQKKIKKMAKIQSLIKLISFCSVVTLTFLFGFKGYIIAVVIVFYLGVIPLFFNVKEDLLLKGTYQKLYSTKLYSYSIYSLITNLINTINASVDIFLLDRLTTQRTELGYYSIATIFILGMNQITGTVQSIATPYFSEKSNNKEEFKRVLFKYQKLLIMVSFILTIGASIVLPIMITVFFGSRYMASGMYFNILVWRYFIWSSYAVTNVALIGLGKMNYNMLTSIIGLFIYSTLGYILINMFGMKGAAFSQVIAAGIALLIQYYMTYNVINKMNKTNE